MANTDYIVTKLEKGTWKQIPMAPGIKITPEGRLQSITRWSTPRGTPHRKNIMMYSIGGKTYSVLELIYMTYVDENLGKQDTVILKDPKGPVCPDNLVVEKWHKVYRGASARSKNRVSLTKLEWINLQWMKTEKPLICSPEKAAEILGITVQTIWNRCKHEKGDLVSYTFKKKIDPFTRYECEFVIEE